MSFDLNKISAEARETYLSATPSERQKIAAIMSQFDASGASADLERIEDAYESEPVPIEKWLESEYHVGKNVVRNMHDKWREEIAYVVNNNIIEWILTGSIGSGKTYTAIQLLLYKIHEIQCLKDPMEYYKAQSIVFGFFSVILNLVHSVEYNMFKNFLTGSKYWCDIVNLDIMEGNSQRVHRAIFNFPKGVSFVFGSRGLHALGQDIHSGLMDEVAFSTSLEAKQVVDLYNSVKRRLESRYLTTRAKLPGTLCLVSSASHEGDWLDNHIKATQDRRLVHISRVALYDVKKFEGDRFRVLVGDKLHRSMILDNDVDVEKLTCKPSPVTPPADARVVNVPVAFYERYRDDIEGSLKDISGVALFATAPFLPQREKVQECIDQTREHPFTIIEPTVDVFNEDLTLEGVFKRDDIFTMVDPYRGVYVPKVNPGAPRFVGMDLALKHDSVGLAVGHMSSVKEVTRHDFEGRAYREVAPVVYFDIILRVKPPRGSEIDLSKIRSFVQMLRQLGMPVAFVSADKFQCFTKDTKISLLDGTEKSFGELEGKDEFWVYSTDEDGNVVPGRGHSCRRTGEKAPILAVELDNGEILRCTLDHQWRMRDGSYREARNLVPGDSLMPLYRRSQFGYEQHLNPATKRWRYTHVSVAKAMNPEYKAQRYDVPNKKVVHHRDFCRGNNSPVNLEVMESAAHSKLHAEHNARNVESGWAVAWKNAEFRERKAKLTSEQAKALWADPVYRERFIEARRNRKQGIEERQKRSRVMMGNRNWEGSWERSCRRCDVEFTAARANTWYCSDLCRAEGFHGRRLAANRAYEERKKAVNNHKVVSVTFAGYEDVYDITVDEHHNFALSAGVFVHNSSDSLQFFAKEGIEVRQISVDKPPCDPYLSLKEAILEGRVSYYRYDPFIEEVTTLQRNYQKKRIDHPPNGSKDSCLTGDNRVLLLDGTSPTVKELRDQRRENFWVFSYDVENDAYVPGLVHRVIDQPNNYDHLLEVELDNGSSVRCTLNHPFLMKDLSYLRADALRVGDSLRPLYLGELKRNGDVYRTICDNRYRRGMKPVYRWVMESLSPEAITAANARCVEDGSKYSVVHHKDHVKFNDDPSNLEALTLREHRKLHGDIFRKWNGSADHLAKVKKARALEKWMAANPEDARRNSSRNGTKNIIKYNKSGAHREVAGLVGRETIKEALKYSNTPEAIEKRKRTRAARRKADPSYRERQNAASRETIVRARQALSAEVLTDCGRRVAALISPGGALYEQRWTSERRTDAADHARRLSAWIQHRRQTGLTKEELPFRQFVPENHKIVAIREIPLEPVFDLVMSEYHNFALASGVFVHNSDAVAQVYWSCAHSKYTSDRLDDASLLMQERPADPPSIPGDLRDRRQVGWSMGDYEDADRITAYDVTI